MSCLQVILRPLELVRPLRDDGCLVSERFNAQEGDEDLLMSGRGIDDVIRTVDALVQVEKTVGEFYGSCSESFPDESEFWLKLAQDEFLHSDVLAKLHALIIRKPHRFAPGKPFPLAALRTFISQVHSDREKLITGDLTMHDALVAAYHIEHTIIEFKYVEVVKTEKPEYIQALDNLETATTKHRERIKKKMDEYGKCSNGKLQDK